MEDSLVKLSGSLWLVTTPGCLGTYTKCLGHVYMKRHEAFAMRGPGEMVVELKLADSASEKS